MTGIANLEIEDAQDRAEEVTSLMGSRFNEESIQFARQNIILRQYEDREALSRTKA